LDFLKGLNSEQRKAVLHTEGPVLILAGAGSGKTRAITHRIAYLIREKGVHPSRILAFTFTNKAAREMKERIEHLLGDLIESIWVGTFHATCVRILRLNAEKAGFDRNFVIFDTQDQQALMRDCLRELDINEKNFPIKSILGEISRAKNELVDPIRFEKAYAADYRMSIISKAYRLYQNKLKKNNALDFDDIIMSAIELFLDHPPVLEYFQDKFRYIHVDEYQDTNTAQYHLISLLARKHGNICVVGDDDQSIYSFRGANIRNILDFEKEFKNTFVIKLEQNYRSTETILSAANSVIANNLGRKSKVLWTNNKKGDKITRYLVENEHDEALAVAAQVKGLERSGEINFRDAAVLYRTNAQSRVIEDIFRREGIPYKILAGVSFYQRKEIKDSMAYLRLVLNPDSDVDFKRIINVPRRGIGNTTIEHLERISAEKGLSLFRVAGSASEFSELSRAASALAKFVEMINGLREDEPGGSSVSRFVKRVIDASGLAEELEKENTEEARSRIENIAELVSAAIDYENRTENGGSPHEFIAEISLASDVDSIDEGNSVLLMTLHSAKGLEFPVVFIVGLEEGVFPGYRAMTDETQLEEERRLFYVGVTRAQKLLYLTSARCRTLYGKTDYYMCSRFVEEIPDNLVNFTNITSDSGYGGYGRMSDGYRRMPGGYRRSSDWW
jgi:DNA helicase-2/ATP-dependent DNA helicase PcrA